MFICLFMFNFLLLSFFNRVAFLRWPCFILGVVLKISNRSGVIKGRRFRCSDAGLRDVYGLPLSNAQVLFGDVWLRLVSGSSKGKGSDVVSLKELRRVFVQNPQGDVLLPVRVPDLVDGFVFSQVSLDVNGLERVNADPHLANVLAFYEIQRLGQSSLDRVSANVANAVSNVNSVPFSDVSGIVFAMDSADADFLLKYGFDSVDKVSAAVSANASLSDRVAFLAVMSSASDSVVLDCLSNFSFEKLSWLYDSVSEFNGSAFNVDGLFLEANFAMLTRFQFLEERMPVDVGDVLRDFACNDNRLMLELLSERLHSTSSSVSADALTCLADVADVSGVKHASLLRASAVDMVSFAVEAGAVFNFSEFVDGSWAGKSVSAREVLFLQSSNVSVDRFSSMVHMLDDPRDAFSAVEAGFSDLSTLDLVLRETRFSSAPKFDVLKDLRSHGFSSYDSMVFHEAVRARWRTAGSWDAPGAILQSVRSKVPDSKVSSVKFLAEVIRNGKDLRLAAALAEAGVVDAVLLSDVLNVAPFRISSPAALDSIAGLPHFWTDRESLLELFSGVSADDVNNAVLLSGVSGVAGVADARVLSSVLLSGLQISQYQSLNDVLSCASKLNVDVSRVGLSEFASDVASVDVSLSRLLEFADREEFLDVSLFDSWSLDAVLPLAKAPVTVFWFDEFVDAGFEASYVAELADNIVNAAFGVDNGSFFKGASRSELVSQEFGLVSRVFNRFYWEQVPDDDAASGDEFFAVAENVSIQDVRDEAVNVVALGRE